MVPQINTDTSQYACCKNQYRVSQLGIIICLWGFGHADRHAVYCTLHFSTWEKFKMCQWVCLTQTYVITKSQSVVGPAAQIIGFLTSVAEGYWVWNLATNYHGTYFQLQVYILILLWHSETGCSDGRVKAKSAEEMFHYHTHAQFLVPLRIASTKYANTSSTLRSQTSIAQKLPSSNGSFFHIL